MTGKVKPYDAAMTILGLPFYTDEELVTAGFRKLGKNVKIGRLSRLCFTENISIGDNSRIDDFTVIVASRESVNIGRYAHIASHCYISGSDGFDMADFCGLSPGVLIFTSSDDYKGGKMTNPTLPRKFIGGPAGKITFDRHVIIGANTVILPNLTIGEGSSVGAQSLVKTSLEPWGIYYGIPAKRRGERSKKLLELERQMQSEP